MELEVYSPISAEAEVKAYTLVGDDIYVKRYTNENIPTWYRQLISDIIAQDSTITDLDAAVDYLSTLPAGYNQKITELQLADTTINTSLTSLVATTGSHTAAIANLNVTKVDATSAAAIARDTVGAYFADGTAGAWFNNQISTYASDIAANAMNVSTLAATLDGQSVRIDTVESVNISQASAIDNLTTTVNALSSDVGVSIAELQAQIDGAISTYFYDYAPSLTNLPASGWLTTTDKLAHVGDLFYDKTTGYGYRFAYEDIVDDPDMGVIFSWIQITDVDVVAALANAATAQATADGKRTVFYGNTTPVPRVENAVTIPIEIGDLWVNSDTKVTKVAVAVSPSVVWGDITNTDTENALLAISVLEETNDGVVNTFYQAAAPISGMSYGDWWIETDVVPIKPYRYEDVNGKNVGTLSWVYKDPTTNILANAMVTSDTTKVKVDQVVAGTLAINVSNATVNGVSLPLYVAAEIDKEVVVFTGTNHTLQTGMKLNDIYIEKTTVTSSSGTVLDVVNTWKYDGTTWVQISNNDNLTKLADKTDGKRTIYSGGALPTGSSTNPLAVNDLFIPTSTFTANNVTYVLNELYRYSGSAWVKATRYDEIQAALTAQIDGKIETYYGGATPPFPNQVNVPKDSRGGDYWYCDVNGTYVKGNVYKYQEAINGSNYNYTWTLSADVSKSAFDLADKKRIIFGNAGTSIPTVAAGLAVSDIWIPSADGNGFTAGKVYKCTAVNPTVTWDEVDYTNDDVVNGIMTGDIPLDPTAVTIGDGTKTLIEYITSEADKRVSVYSGTTAPVSGQPTGVAENDIYLYFTSATSAGVTYDITETYKYVGSVWVKITTNDNITKLADITDGKRTVFANAGTDVPLAMELNDIWIPASNSADGTTYVKDEIYIWKLNPTVPAWVKATKYTDDSALNSFLTVTYASDLSDVYNQIDGKSVSYFQETEPFAALSGTEAQNGDMWFKGSSKELKVFVFATHTWDLITDPKATEAYTLAGAAQATAEGKIQNFTSTPVTPYYVGDTWMQGSTGDIYVCNVKRISGSFMAGDWIRASKYTDDTTANAKSQILYSNTEPTIATHPLLDVGDQWVNTVDGLVKVWNGTAWVDVVAKSTAEVMQQLTDLEEARDGNVVVYYETSTTLPTGMTYGDYLVDTDSWSGSVYTVYRYENSTGGSTGTLSWYVNTGDTARALSAGYRAQVLAGTAQSTADGKVKTWYQTSTPTGLTASDVGDLWVDTDGGNKVQVWSGSAWVDPTTAQGSQAYTWSANASKLITSPDGSVTGWSFGDGSNIKSYFQIQATNFKISDGTTGYTPFSIVGSDILFNGKVSFTNVTGTPVINQTFVQTTAPTSGMVAGDTWIDSDGGYAVYTYSGSSWVAGGSKTYSQTSAPTSGMVAGDLWVDTDDNNKLYRYNGTSWVNQTITSGGIISAINGTTNTTTIDGGKITTGSITTTQLNATDIKAGNIFVDNTLRSSDFTAIGGAGFRLKSNAAGTSADPTIYGAYIRGGQLEGQTLNVSSFKVFSTLYPNNFGKFFVNINGDTPINTASAVSTFYSPSYGTGFNANRILRSDYGIKLNLYGNLGSYIQRSVDGGAWETVLFAGIQIASGTAGFYYNRATLTFLYDTAPFTSTKEYRVYAGGNEKATFSFECINIID